MSAAVPARVPRRRNAARHIAALLLLMVGAWCAGFAWFVRETAPTGGPPPQADGIVVLTGGAGRVSTALHLLASGRGQVLLISGVNRTTDFAGLARAANVDPALADRVTLGRAAADTRGNAAETAAWAEEHHLHSLLVVTAGYHMPRALAELRQTVPGLVLTPVAVLPPAMRDGATGSKLRLLAEEYTKWLVAEAGLTQLASRMEEHGG